MPAPIVTPERLILEAAKRAQQRMTEHIERFAAAYISLTDIPADQAVLMHKIRDDGTSVIWFERKANEMPDTPPVPLEFTDAMPAWANGWNTGYKAAKGG